MSSINDPFFFYLSFKMKIIATAQLVERQLEPVNLSVNFVRAYTSILNKEWCLFVQKLVCRYILTNCKSTDHLCVCTHIDCVNTFAAIVSVGICHWELGIGVSSQLKKLRLISDYHSAILFLIEISTNNTVD